MLSWESFLSSPVAVWTLCAMNYTHELSGLENWLPLHRAKGMQESINILSLFFPLLPSKFIPVLTEEQLRTVWPRPIIPVSTCNATSTYTSEIPLSLFLQSTPPAQGPWLCYGVAAAAEAT